MASSMRHTRSIILRYVGLVLLSGVLFLWSRAHLPWMDHTPEAILVVMAYAGVGVLWSAALEETLQVRALLTAGAWMACAGLLVSSRSGASAPQSFVALILVIGGVALVWNVVALGLSVRQQQGDFKDRLWGSLLDLLPDVLRRFAAKEGQVWLAILWPPGLTRGISGEPFSMGFTGSDVFAMRVLMGIGVIELSTVHLLLVHRFPVAALILLLPSIVGLLYLFGIARTLRIMPTTIGDVVLTVRLGLLRSKTIQLAMIDRAECCAPEGIVKGERLEYSIIDPPNVRLVLREPLYDTSLLRVRVKSLSLTSDLMIRLYS
ncbi:MAG: hypothetical protein ACKOAN_10290 [Chakrabartia sp.]